VPNDDDNDLCDFRQKYFFSTLQLATEFVWYRNYGDPRTKPAFYVLVTLS
jgi:hypothetical protein